MNTETWENKMAKKTATFENKRDVELHGWKPGEQKDILIDVNGTPLDKNFRRRLKDNDIELVKKKKGGK